MTTLLLPQLITALLVGNSLLIVGMLIYDERDPSTTLAWALLLFMFPGLGLLFYIICGRNWRRISRRDVSLADAVRFGDEQLRPVYEAWSHQASEHLATQPTVSTRLARAITRQNDTRLLPCTNLTVMCEGAIKFPALFADIERATDTIHLEYFIWESDEMTGRLCELLARKVAAGVKVRVLYDWIGSLPFRKKQLAALKAAGGEVRADIAHWSRLNYRNHRKMAVIDGRIGYTGGMNMGQEYIDGKPRYESWRDTHLRFEGPLVAELQRLYCEQWYRVTGESLFTDRYFPELTVNPGERVVWSQLAYSGPETPYQAIRNAFLLAIHSAEKTVRIQSPYFVPDEPIFEALVTQSFAGVKVDFMMAGIPDKKIAWDAAFSYIGDFVEAGGELNQYFAGFFHAKTMTIDGVVASFGTTNFDIRSFTLHDELSIFFYDAQVAQEQDRIFAVDRESCRQVDQSTYDGFSMIRTFRIAFARLWSRLL